MGGCGRGGAGGIWLGNYSEDVLKGSAHRGAIAYSVVVARSCTWMGFRAPQARTEPPKITGAPLGSPYNACMRRLQHRPYTSSNKLCAKSITHRKKVSMLQNNRMI